ncbi:MAG: hypothetical protein ACRDSM_18465 [Pseudonocardiaceae bacterium]
MTAQQETTEKSRFKARLGPVEFDVPSRAALMILVISLLLLLLVLFFPAQSKAIFTTIQGVVSRSVTVPGGGTDPGAGRTLPPAGPGTSGTGGSLSNSTGGSLSNSGISQALSPADSITALRSINVDFSVPREVLEQWLGNPKYTSYPAISSVLVKGRKLRDWVFIDVIVFNYENTPGVKPPRTESDVRIDVLKAAVLEGYNERHGTSESSFDAIIT